MLYVFLNTKRMPVEESDPRAGEVYPFISVEPKVAAAFDGEMLREYGFSFGLKLPAFVARLFGWRVRELGA